MLSVDAFVADWGPDSDEQARAEFRDQLANFVKSTAVQSYWNGVSHCATGKVKPKTERA